MGNKLQKGGSNPGPFVKPNSNTMLNYQLSYKFKLIGFRFNVNIMSFNSCEGRRGLSKSCSYPSDIEIVEDLFPLELGSTDVIQGTKW